MGRVHTDSSELSQWSLQFPAGEMGTPLVLGLPGTPGSTAESESLGCCPSHSRANLGPTHSFSSRVCDKAFQYTSNKESFKEKSQFT